MVGYPSIGPSESKKSSSGADGDGGPEFDISQVAVTHPVTESCWGGVCAQALYCAGSRIANARKRPNRQGRVTAGESTFADGAHDWAVESARTIPRGLTRFESMGLGKIVDDLDWAI